MLLNKIREATKETHTLLESNSIMRSFSQGDITLENYIIILNKFYEFTLPLEHQLNNYQLGNLVSHFNGRRKSFLLYNDLVILNNHPGNVDVHSTLKLNNVEEAFGALYVMEGSTLGGIQISKILQSSLNIFPESGGSFFYGYGNITGKMWKLFLEDLQSFSEKNNNENAVVEGAMKTFTSLYQHLK